MLTRSAAVSALLVLTGGLLYATIFGSVRGLIHDPEHRPVTGASVKLQAERSEWTQTAMSTDSGEFQFNAVPVGEYTISVQVPGFEAAPQKITVVSGSAPILHFALAMARPTFSVEVLDKAEQVDTQASSASAVISRKEIAETPGADRTNSMAMITNFVPGSYVIHDQLHVRGGHEFEWLLDGVPVPNTNIASNVGPQFDPKDVDYIEAQRGGFSAEYGDRAYGVFNVVTRSGFERNNEGELVTSYGTQNTTDNQISFGSHTERFAYYTSLSGNRSDLGLETPDPRVLHDLGAGLSAFGSLIFNKTPTDQLRLVTSVRGDHYQVPNALDQQALGIRDVENERDAFANFSWVHTYKNGALLTVSPFYHFNRAHYIGALNRDAAASFLGAGSDAPVIPEDNRASSYLGGVLTLGVVRGRHNAHVGLQGFAQHDDHLFAITPADPELAAVRARETPWGGVATVFLEDQYKVWSWLTLNGGVRLTHFSGQLSENAADPRVGAAVRIPRLKWVLRGFYGRYYEPPPLASVAGPVLSLAADQGFGFLPLRGERVEQHEFGISIPFSGWVADLAHFRTGARNFFDHDVLGNSNIFFPVTLQSARIRGWEASVRSPRMFHTASLKMVYSRQVVQARGGVTGGLTDFSPPASGGYYFLDHDQRHTASAVLQLDLPWRVHAGSAVSYGSGFLDGDGPAHLPPHTTLDLSLGRSVGERVAVTVSATNLTNKHYLLDNSNTFGGTHFANPRQLMLQVRYKFHY